MKNSLLKTVIFSAPQGWGKTRNAAALCDQYGCVNVVDEWTPASAVSEGALHLTNVPPNQIPEGYLLTADLVSCGW